LDLLQECLQDVLRNWNRMQTSDMDDAGEDADRFQTSFYRFISQVEIWVQNLDVRPPSVEVAKRTEGFKSLFESLPEMLNIPFETELEMILDNVIRTVDSTEQS